jgi:hypothetical protein
MKKGADSIEMDTRVTEMVKAVEKTWQKRGRAPSLRELANETGLSVGWVHAVVNAACERGQLVKEPHGARTIRVPRPGEATP